MLPRPLIWAISTSFGFAALSGGEIMRCCKNPWCCIFGSTFDSRAGVRVAQASSELHCARGSFRWCLARMHFASINDESPRERAFVLQCLSGPMSRVLSLKTAIYLGRALPHASSRLPACTERLNRIACLFALASDGVYQATPLLTCWCALTAPSQLFS